MAVERPAVIPLSFAQNRLWFLDQLQGPSPVYNMAVALQLRGKLDVDALRAAFDDVIGRHESLRTTFPDIDGVPFQQVLPPPWGEVVGDVIDAAGWPPALRHEAIDAAARHTFDLGTEIPFRAELFRIADDEHVLVGVVHHIAADGWSITPLVCDLNVAYASRLAGRAPDWAELPVQYVDYTLWQHAQFGDLATPTVPSLGSWRIGRMRWRGCLNTCSYRRTDLIRLWLINAGALSPWTGRPSCSSACAMSPASTTRPLSW